MLKGGNRRGQRHGLAGRQLVDQFRERSSARLPPGPKIVRPEGGERDQGYPPVRRVGAPFNQAGPL